MNFRPSALYLLYLPGILLSYDFLPEWFYYLYNTLIILLTLFRLPRFVSYLTLPAVYYIFATVGRQIIPETMVPFLAVFIFMRLIDNKHKDHFEIYPLFLWLSAFSLFSSTLYYILYILSCSLVLFIYHGQSQFSLKEFFKNLYKYKSQLLIAGILSSILFVFFPRFHRFLPSANNTPQGEIGYSKSINNSQTVNLNLSSKIAFYAELDKKINSELLYWRGRVHSATDGYNWSSQQTYPDRFRTETSEPIRVTQKLKYEQKFDGDIIALDIPERLVRTNSGIHFNKSTREFKLYDKKRKTIVDIISVLRQTDNITLNKENRKRYLKTPDFTPNELKRAIERIPSTTPEKILEEFEDFLLQEKFTYSLRPGLLPTMKDFLLQKRGYCSHYASLLGIIFRKKGIPSRLVSGFQGGEYNKIGNYYIIRSNDAHAWVEYFHQNKWNRVDPTGLIAPTRINEGTLAFLNQQSGKKETQTFLGKYLNSFNQYMSIINYRVSLFLDNYDRNSQKELSKLLKLNFKVFLTLGPAFILIIGILFYFFIKKQDKVQVHPADKLIYAFFKKNKIKYSNGNGLLSIKMLTELAHDLSSPYKTDLIEHYQRARYANSSQSLAQLEKLTKQVFAKENS